MIPELLVLGALIAVILVLILSMFRLRKSNYGALANHMAKRTRAEFQVLRPCPVCHEMLAKGETVHSVVFGKGGEDRIAHIFGCRYCHPHNERHPRICPVCKATVSADGYLIARMFERRIPVRAGGGTSRSVGYREKTHVHVLGCTECRAGRPGGRSAQR